MNYTLNVDRDGRHDVELWTRGNGIRIASGYNRIVIGGRGPYVEFADDQILLESFHIPKEQLYRLTDSRVYYVEFRSNDENNIKLYYQLKTVAYADYKIGMFYISPYEVFISLSGVPLAESKLKTTTKENQFFS